MTAVEEMNNLLDEHEASRYHKEGYICISNRYRIIGRPDRDDWHVALAEQMRCAPADFYLKDGSGKLCPRWREHYVRCNTKDTLEISETTFNKLKKLNNRYAY